MEPQSSTACAVSPLAVGNAPDVEYRELSFEPFGAGYRVGDDGSVWTRKNARWGLRDEWREMRQTGDGVGYKCVRLMCRDKRPRKFRVNVLVLLAFVSPRPTGADSCHCNGDPHDNRRANLRWDSRAANMMDASRHGRLANRRRA